MLQGIGLDTEQGGGGGVRGGGGEVSGGGGGVRRGGLFVIGSSVVCVGYEC